MLSLLTVGASSRWWVLLLAALLLMGAVHTAGAEEAARKLVVVSTPFGGDDGAAIARSLLPIDDHRDTLVPLKALSRERADDGADAGVPDAGAGSDELSVAEQAREAALAFDLVLAAELWRRAADALTASSEVVFDPAKVAGVLMEAGAASAAAGERDLSLLYFRRAIAVDSSVRPGPEISPEGKRLFESGRKLGPVLLEIPRDAVLADICSEVGVDGLVWVAAGRDRNDWEISFKLYMVGETASELETRRHPMPMDEGKIGRERNRLQGLIDRKLLGDAAMRRPVVTIGSGETVVEKPWYRKWWVYTIGGALIAGGAAGITTWLVLQPDEATVTAHY